MEYGTAERYSGLSLSDEPEHAQSPEPDTPQIKNQGPVFPGDDGVEIRKELVITLYSKGRVEYQNAVNDVCPYFHFSTTGIRHSSGCTVILTQVTGNNTVPRIQILVDFQMSIPYRTHCLYYSLMIKYKGPPGTACRISRYLLPQSCPPDGFSTSGCPPRNMGRNAAQYSTLQQCPSYGMPSRPLFRSIGHTARCSSCAETSATVSRPIFSKSLQPLLRRHLHSRQEACSTTDCLRPGKNRQNPAGAVLRKGRQQYMAPVPYRTDGSSAFPWTGNGHRKGSSLHRCRDGASNGIEKGPFSFAHRCASCLFVSRLT